MPQLPVEFMLTDIQGEEKDILNACFVKGRLRASKPCKANGGATMGLFEGKVNYCWRMLCFSFCSARPHCCIPVCADFDISRFFYVHMKNGVITRDQQRAQEKEIIESMNDLLKRFEGTIPVVCQAGTMIWGKALGMI
jgi:hypothetical protein